MSGWVFLALSLLGLQAALAWVPRLGLALLPYALGGSGLALLVGGVGAFALRGDVPGFYLGLLGSLYLALGPYLGVYLAHHPGPRARLEAFLFPLFMGALVGVVLAPPGYPFLFLWEGMALLGFLLIALEGPEAVGGSQAFFLASRLSGVGLFLAFLFAREAPLDLVWAGLLVGFGTKAGLFPLHLWLPKAHPVAISPLSALLSGGMVKLGLYGLYRAPEWVAPPPLWVGWALVGLGLSGAVYALVRGIAERDFKGVLAYSSVENLNLLLAALGGYFLTQVATYPLGQKK
jgi:hydrogenase-4 component B